MEYYVAVKTMRWNYAYQYGKHVQNGKFFLKKNKIEPTKNHLRFLTPPKTKKVNICLQICTYIENEATYTPL